MTLEILDQDDQDQLETVRIGGALDDAEKEFTDEWEFLQGNNFHRTVKTKDRNYRFTAEEEDAYLLAAEDPIFFAEHFIRILHPTKGEVPFKMYPYQKRMMTAYVNHRLVVAMQARQSGKTETTAAFLLWFCIFHKNVKVLIAANKFEHVQMVIKRIRFSYATMPDKFKPALIADNARSLEFSNGSTIEGVATTEDSGRGKSITLLYVDEMGFIPPRVAKEFWASIRPTLATGGKCFITSTPYADDDEFATIWNEANDKFDEFGYERPNGVGKNGFYAFIAKWDEHPDRNQAWADAERASIGDGRWEREYELKFIGFDETLIPGRILSELRGRDEEFITGEVRWFAKPEPNKIYLIGMDLGGGGGGDFSTIQVLQLPECKQIAEWRSNKTLMRGQVKVLRDVLQIIDAELRQHPRQMAAPEIYWSYEANGGYGDHCLEIIEEMGMETFPGEFISEPISSVNRSGRRRRGLWTTNRTKIKACLQLQSLMNSRRLELVSKPLIRELKYFVAAGGSWKAKVGEHDDLICALLVVMRILEYMKAQDEILYDTLNFGTEDDDNDYSAPMPVGVVFGGYR